MTGSTTPYSELDTIAESEYIINFKCSEHKFSNENAFFASKVRAWLLKNPDMEQQALAEKLGMGRNQLNRALKSSPDRINAKEYAKKVATELDVDLSWLLGPLSENATTILTSEEDVYNEQANAHLAISQQTVSNAPKEQLELAAKLKAAYNKSSLTYDQMAKKIGQSKSLVSKVLNGQLSVASHLLPHYADAFNVSIAWLTSPIGSDVSLREEEPEQRQTDGVVIDSVTKDPMTNALNMAYHGVVQVPFSAMKAALTR